MRSLTISRFTSKSPLRLLDVAYLVVLLPLILTAKLPMLLYMLLVFFLLLFRKKPTTLTLLFTALFGLFALFFSLYGAFNFTGLSRLSLFIELLVYLLILAVSLQRMTREINFYLIVSPMLLLALSLFFFHSIAMLIYVVIEIYILLWLVLSHRMQGTLRETSRMTAMYFVSSLPWVVLLFIFFPRISFEHASYGFRGDEGRRMGHDGTMHLDGKALLVLSDRIVMEVGFAKKVPPSNQLYFRGSLLYADKKDHWDALPERVTNRQKSKYESAKDLIVYKVSLYPTHKRWLYLLDLPFEAPEGAEMDVDFVTTVNKDLEEPLHYEATSALRYRYGGEVMPELLEAASSFDRQSNPKSFALAEKIKADYPNLTERSAVVAEVFREQNLTYTLRPELLDLNNSTDSFLFQKREGYCVHFASSFVIFSRMAGIPARIVTGYKGDPQNNSVNNYLIIKERDAHAWAEVLIDHQWKRVETTSFASGMTMETQALLDQDHTQKNQGKFFKQANLYLMYLKYQAETWILEYSHFRQMQLLDKVKRDSSFVLKFIVAILLLVLLSMISIGYLRRPICTDSILCALAPLLRRLKNLGFVRQDGETMHAFFCRYLDAHPDIQELRRIDEEYESIRYGGESSNRSEKVFRESIKKCVTRLSSVLMK